MNLNALGPVILVGLLVAFEGCRKPVAENDSPVSPEAITVAPPLGQPAAVSSGDLLAPEGTFFLLSKTSVSTDEGIIGLKPGTRVTLKALGQYFDDEGHALAIDASQVTNDLRVAARVAGSDAVTQAVLQKTAAQRNRAGEAAHAASVAAAAAADAAAAAAAAAARNTAPVEPSAPDMSKPYGQKKGAADRSGMRGRDPQAPTNNSR